LLDLGQRRRIPAMRQVRRIGPAQPLATLAQAGRPRGPVDDGEFNHLALVLQRENDRHEPLRRRAAAPIPAAVRPSRTSPAAPWPPERSAR
jgi:hypothetical protein